MIRYLAGCCNPHLVSGERCKVRERTTYVHQALMLTNDVTVKGYSQSQRLLSGLLHHFIDMIDYHVTELGSADVTPYDRHAVIYLPRVRQG